MPDRDAARRALRSGLAAQLARIGTSLELVAEDVIGEEDAPIDWIASAPDGRAWIVLVEPATGDGRMLEQALVQCAWVQARIRDWIQLAPSLGLRAELVPRALLIARDFGRVTRIAARLAAGEDVLLARWSGDQRAPALDVLEPPARRSRGTPGASPRPLVSVFRSGLTDTDLAS
jgi:hypothetical protein